MQRVHPFSQRHLPDDPLLQAYSSSESDAAIEGEGGINNPCRASILCLAQIVRPRPAVRTSTSQIDLTQTRFGSSRRTMHIISEGLEGSWKSKAGIYLLGDCVVFLLGMVPSASYHRTFQRKARSCLTATICLRTRPLVVHSN